jgi:hypothetical protein
VAAPAARLRPRAAARPRERRRGPAGAPRRARAAARPGSAEAAGTGGAMGGHRVQDLREGRPCAVGRTRTGRGRLDASPHRGRERAGPADRGGRAGRWRRSRSRPR